MAIVQTIVSFATSTIKSLFLLNGGAVIALLALYGHSVSSEANPPIFDVHALVPAIESFVKGLVAAFVCSALAYVAQVLFAEGSRWVSDWLGGGVRILAVIAVAFSLYFFIEGAWAAMRAFATGGGAGPVVGQ